MEKTCNEMKLGEEGIIKKISLDEPKYFKVIHLGAVEGSVIKCLFKSPFQTPIAYQIHGCVFALRDIDAKKIKVDCYE